MKVGKWAWLGALLVAASFLLVAFIQMKDMRSPAVKDAVKVLREEKQKLIERGEYGCCLKTPCDQCLINMGACPCGKNAKEGKPVCHECKGGWYANDGAIKGKKAGDIKVMPRMPMGH
jgi:hypothetical protein